MVSASSFVFQPINDVDDSFHGNTCNALRILLLSFSNGFSFILLPFCYHGMRPMNLSKIHSTIFFFYITFVHITSHYFKMLQIFVCKDSQTTFMVVPLKMFINKFEFKSKHENNCFSI